MSLPKKNDLCLGYLTGKCIHDDSLDCKDIDKSKCFPPVCEDMKIIKIDNRPTRVWCRAKKDFVNPWEVCLKCNPKDSL